MFLQTIKAVLIFILNLIKKSLCCLKRRRKVSVDVVPLTGVGVVSDYHASQEGSNGDDLSTWNHWDASEGPPQSVEEHIQLYRNQQQLQRASSEHTTPQPSVDFFQGMEPKIMKQKKVLLRPPESSSDVSSRLNFVPEGPVPDDSGELEAWEDTDYLSGRWNEASVWNTDEIIKQKRREDMRKKLIEKEQLRRNLIT